MAYMVLRPYVDSRPVRLFVCVFVEGIIYTILGRVFGDSGDDE